MKSTDKIRDLTLKNAIIIVTYIALLVLGLKYFGNIMNFLGKLVSIIQPFIIGFILAFVFNIPMKFFIKKLNIKNERKKKIVAAIMSVTLILLLVFLLIMVVVPQVVQNVSTLIDNLPTTLSTAESWLNIILEKINASTDIISKLEEFQMNLGKTIISSLSTWVPGIASGVTHVTTGIINLFMGFVMSIYMLFSKDTLMRQVRKLSKAIFNEDQYRHALEVVHLTSTTFENFLAGQITESVIIGVLCYIGCTILDIPYASIATVVIGFTNIIPYFGPIIGACISCVLILFVSPIKAIIFLIFSTLLQQFESNLIYPHVVGGSVGLSALWVLFAVSAGGGLFGIPGMIFGLPTFSVLYELVKRWTNHRLKEKEKRKIQESI